MTAISGNTTIPRGNPISDNELRDLMYQDYSRANDPNVQADHRFLSLLNASMIASALKDSGRSVPSELLDKENVNRRLLSLGQQFLAEQRHAINSHIGVENDIAKPNRFAKIEKMIKELAEAGLQSEEKSYAMFGGKEAFDKLKEQETRLANAPPRARGIETVNDKQPTEAEKSLNKSATLGAFTAIVPPAKEPFNFDINLSNQLSGDRFKIAATAPLFSVVDARALPIADLAASEVLTNQKSTSVIFAGNMTV